MKNQTSKVLALIIIGFILISIGCSGNVPQNNQSNSNSDLSNQNNSDKEIDKDKNLSMCTEVESKIIGALPKDVAKQLNKNLYLSYSTGSQVLTLSGEIYVDYNSWQKFIATLDNFRSEDCVRVISFQGKTVNKKFKWCPTNECKTESPDYVNKCNKITVIDPIFNKSSVSDQINIYNNLSQKYNTGNDGILPIIGVVKDKPNSKTFSSLFADLLKIESCITNITLEPNSENMNNNLLKQGFEWQICEGGQCECNGRCISCNDSCVRKIDNTNTNGSKSNSNIP
jgi:hypothetical protein